MRRRVDAPAAGSTNLGRSAVVQIGAVAGVLLVAIAALVLSRLRRRVVS